TLRGRRRVLALLGRALERGRVARELRVGGEDLAQGGHDLRRRGGFAREDARHVVLRRTVERDAILVLYAEQVRERVEGFAPADAHVARELGPVTVREEARSPVRAH